MRDEKSANSRRSGRPGGARFVHRGKECPFGVTATRNGMTLVEVVGGLALLATLLVALLLAKGRYTHQAALADRRLVAASAADALLTSWHQDPSSLVRDGTGTIEDLSWRTRIVDNPAVSQLDAQVVRLEILDNHQQILTSVEFVADSNSTKAVNLQQAIKKRTKTKR